MKALLLSAAICIAGLSVAAEGWGNLDALLFSHLTRSGSAEASYWLPNSIDPAQATAAFGVVYEHIAGSAGNTTIAVGLFLRPSGGQWGFAGPVADLFGHNPRDVVFEGGFAMMTTTMPGPNDPRCCPTVPTRWRIDLARLQAWQAR
ncbi:hypothetical protein [Sulfitobacter mediterraneus]|uniref:Uncharacterized protein n=1 Tax=Sulfitobacter mediterraneus TaxID=83219 RepID=A0A061SX07_9RHOB|nr:hypothetical protein [Sulfitobacter mediterraneus]KAJ04648.1 hypothetical protein PM02_03915 [Sulfitobacter mediterraneus]